MSVLHNMMIADRIVSLGLLAAGLSHHIRNALVAVKTFLDLAPTKMQEEKLDLEGVRNPEFWREYYQSVQGQITKINNMLRELGCASEGAAEFTDEIKLDEVMGVVLEKLQTHFQARSLQIDNQIPSTLPPLRVDRTKFSRLFELLLKDEIASLPCGSRITLKACVPASLGPGSDVEVTIEDNGPGLPQDALRLIFDPFVVRTDSPAEYGINLMACYFIVHHHGGRITATSHAGQGTIFTVRLPTNPADAPLTDENPDFLRKVLLNETLWERLATRMIDAADRR